MCESLTSEISTDLITLSSAHILLPFETIANIYSHFGLTVHIQISQLCLFLCSVMRRRSSLKLPVRRPARTCGSAAWSIIPSLGRTTILQMISNAGLLSSATFTFMHLADAFIKKQFVKEPTIFGNGRFI